MKIFKSKLDKIVDLKYRLDDINERLKFMKGKFHFVNIKFHYMATNDGIVLSDEDKKINGILLGTLKKHLLEEKILIKKKLKKITGGK